MSDFEQFLQAKRLTPKPGLVEPGEPRPWDAAPVPGLPALSDLLSRATVTPVLMGGREFQLLAFGPAEQRRGWLTLPKLTASQAEGLALLPLHREILTRFGGIGEVFGADRGWWTTNDVDILAPSSSGFNLAGTLDAYAWAWEEEDLEIPISAADHYVVAKEANSNLTLVDRGTGRILLSAPDHAYDGLTELDGCPPYSLYTIDDAPDFTSWVELNATAWSNE